MWISRFQIQISQTSPPPCVNDGIFDMCVRPTPACMPAVVVVDDGGIDMSSDVHDGIYAEQGGSNRWCDKGLNE